MTASEYTKEENEYLSQFSTARRLFWGRMYIDNRRKENSHLALPPGVVEDRRRNDDLHEEIRGRLNELNENTTEIRNSFSDFWSGIGQMWGERNGRKLKKK